MELENSQNNALAKLPMLKLGEYEMWEIRIKAVLSDPRLCIMGATKKTKTTTRRKRPESLDSIFNRLQKLVSRLAILGVDTPPDDLNVQYYNTVNTGVSTGTTKVNTASTETSTASFSDATVYAFLSTQPQGSQLVHEDLEQIS
ncbi:hypothetical protein Tco_1284336 [Tanacetum coccineum]